MRRRSTPSGSRHVLSAVLLLVAVGLASSVGATPQQSVTGVRGVAEVHTVINFADLARREALTPPKKLERFVAPYMPMPPRKPVPASAVPSKVEPLASAVAPPTPSVPSPGPAANFEALGDDDTTIPPDTQGAVGPNHLMVTLNSQVRIQDRSGSVMSTVTLNSFWASTGATGVFDPKLVYEPFGNRWVFTALSNSRSAASSLLIGVSQTNDPTGTWNLFRVDVDSTNVDWGDYPSLGFNKDWIVVTLNLFAVSNNQFSQIQIYTFNKANLYAGTSATFTLFTDDAFTLAPALTYDNSLATMHLVENFNGNFMGSGFLRLCTVTGPVGSEVYTSGTTFVSTPNPWASAPPGGADFAPQQGTTQKIQNNDSRILGVVFRNGSLWATQTAFLPANGPTTRAAAQWWQFTPAGTVQQFGRVDDSTGTFFYAFSSIAVNLQNDVLLGYSSFSGSQFASASYSFRAGTDLPNTMRDDALLKAGEAVYFKTFSGTRNRWGDYSNTVVDPVNDLDLWTIQEYASSPDFMNGDDRWGTWWGKISVTPAKKRRGQLISQ